MPVSPLKASLGQLKGCRHTLFRQKKIYLLYNEGEAYVKKMDEAGVPVSLVRIIPLSEVDLSFFNDIKYMLFPH